MVDKRSKMIDLNKVVFTCIRCGYKYIGTLEGKVYTCPKCKHEDTFVIESQYIVVK